MKIKSIKTFVVGILVKNAKYLAEKRHGNEEHFGGLTVFLGGLIEEGESSENASAPERK